MDVARPARVVLDKSFGIELLDEETRKVLSQDEIYVRSGAESISRTIFHSEHIKIAAASRRPLDEVEWHTQKLLHTRKQIDDIRTNEYRVRLDHVPLDEQQISVKAVHPDVLPSGRRHKSLHTYRDVPFQYRVEAGIPEVWLEATTLSKLLISKKVGPSWDVGIEITYGSPRELWVKWRSEGRCSAGVCGAFAG
jgi:hypothetical protein